MAESSPPFIVCERREPAAAAGPVPTAYQTEAELEREFIEDLRGLGYDVAIGLKTPEDMLANARQQLQTLNRMEFSEKEWERFVEEYLDKPGEGLVEKTRRIQDDYVCDFVFDDGHIQNIYLVDKKDLARNKVQVISQFEQKGSHANRYDVTILVNGLPLAHVELKKRGVAIREAFNQVHRYSKESFNAGNSLFKYIQVFVISNGTDTRYFANTTTRDKNSFGFTMNWAAADNTPIGELRDFTASFFRKHTLLNVILTYSVFDTNNTLLIMRPYQIAATERVLAKIRSAHQSGLCSVPGAGGYIWHTTGSGKTLTSFKTARLASQLEFIDKVFFVVDRKDLDYQTMKEYQRFSPDSVNGSDSTAGLKRNIALDDNKIIVTTLQKLNNLMKGYEDLPVYGQQVVFIFDEAHRSQFGDVRKLLKKRFKSYYPFGFTGTPIFPSNAQGEETTESVFGERLHSYVITDAIRDGKVLKFKVDYNDVRPRFRALETEHDEKKLSAAESKEALLHPDRINAICRYILQNFRLKTHRNQGGKGFNAMFAVSSVDAAKCYYQELRLLQKGSAHPLKIATIFSYAANEEQNAIGDIADEGFEPSAMDSSAKEFLEMVLRNYNDDFGTAFGVESKGFQNYYRDLARRVKNGEIDLVIVVGMFLTGFDAPALNTLFVDKNLRYHGLMQAFSRTNRIYDSTKAFGNIVTFRNLEQNTADAIRLFGNSEAEGAMLVKGYQEYMGMGRSPEEAQGGYLALAGELKARFPHVGTIVTESDKKDFVKLFGQFLRLENILQNYDEFTLLKAAQNLDKNSPAAMEAFRAEHGLSEDALAAVLQVELLSARAIQDYKSAYHDIRDWLQRERKGAAAERALLDWDDVVFEVDLLKTQEINLDYILNLIAEHHRSGTGKAALAEEISRKLRSSADNRAKESLIVSFINDTDLNAIARQEGIIDAFFAYARIRQKEAASELIAQEGLREEEAKRYMMASLKRGYASEKGTDFNAILPRMSPLNPDYITTKRRVFRKVTSFVEVFRGVGGQL